MKPFSYTFLPRIEGVLLLFLLLCARLVCSQSAPLFQSVFYFEDGQGNTDTIAIGGSTLVNNLTFDTAAYRGDIVLTADQNKPFEVFTLPWYDLIYNNIYFPGELAHGFSPAGYHYYRDVVVDYDSLTGAESVFFLFKTQHMPITIHWDAAFYANLPDNNPLKAAHLLPDHLRYSKPDWVPQVDYTIDQFKCLQYDNTWDFHLGQNADYNVTSAKVYGFIDNYDHVMYGLLLNMSPYFDCSAVSGIPDTEPTAATLFPNPATDKITINLKRFHIINNGRISVWSVAGQEVYTQELNADTDCITIDLHTIPSGMYFYGIRKEHALVYGGTFLK